MHLIALILALTSPARPAFAAPESNVYSFCDILATRRNADLHESAENRQILRTMLGVDPDAPLVVLTDAPDLTTARTDEAMRAALAHRLAAVQPGAYVFFAFTGPQASASLKQVCAELKRQGLGWKFVKVDPLGRRGVLVHTATHSDIPF